MGLNFKDVLKEHKKILLSALGIIVVVIILGVISSRGEDVFTLSNDITDGGVEDLVDDNSGSKQGYNNPPSMQISSGKDYGATIYTSFGQITVDLFEKETPITVNNFVFLSKEGFYNGLTFHRVIRNFVIQGGDPKGDGTGGPGYSFNDEIDAVALGLDKIKVSEASYLRSFYNSSVLVESKDMTLKEFYEKYVGYEYTEGSGGEKFSPYVLAMANSGPNTNGSQFFIAVKTFAGLYLDGKHTVFGKVIDGFSVVDAIEKVNTDGNGRPSTAVKIYSISIVEK